MAVLGGVSVLKSGLRILIWAPQVPFSVPLKNPKWVILGVFGYFPLKPKIFTANGRKCPTAKQKSSIKAGGSTAICKMCEWEMEWVIPLRLLQLLELLAVLKSLGISEQNGTTCRFVQS